MRMCVFLWWGERKVLGKGTGTHVHSSGRGTMNPFKKDQGRKVSSKYIKKGQCSRGYFRGSP